MSYYCLFKPYLIKMMNVHSWTTYFVAIVSKSLLRVCSARKGLEFKLWTSGSLPVSAAGPMKTTEGETRRSQKFGWQSRVLWFCGSRVHLNTERFLFSDCCRLKSRRVGIIIWACRWWTGLCSVRLNPTCDPEFCWFCRFCWALLCQEAAVMSGFHFLLLISSSNYVHLLAASVWTATNIKEYLWSNQLMAHKKAFIVLFISFTESSQVALEFKDFKLQQQIFLWLIQKEKTNWMTSRTGHQVLLDPGLDPIFKSEKVLNPAENLWSSSSLKGSVWTFRPRIWTLFGNVFFTRCWETAVLSCVFLENKLLGRTAAWGRRSGSIVVLWRKMSRSWRGWPHRRFLPTQRLLNMDLKLLSGFS